MAFPPPNCCSKQPPCAHMRMHASTCRHANTSSLANTGAALGMHAMAAQAGEDEREPLVRENVPDSDDEGEQTWPTEAEIADAQRMFQRRLSKHKVPEGEHMGCCAPQGPLCP